MFGLTLCGWLLRYYRVVNLFPFRFAAVQLVLIVLLYGYKDKPFKEYHMVGAIIT